MNLESIRESIGNSGYMDALQGLRIVNRNCRKNISKNCLEEILALFFEPFAQEKKLSLSSVFESREKYWTVMSYNRTGALRRFKDSRVKTGFISDNEIWISFNSHYCAPLLFGYAPGCLCREPAIT